MKTTFLALASAALMLGDSLSQISPAVPKPTLTDGKVLSLFKERATAEEIAKFRQLAVARDGDSQTRALEMVLFKLTDAEMFQIGVTSLKQSDWAVAWSTDSNDDGTAIANTLKPLGISPIGSFGRGSGGWYVPREKFFAAQRALMKSEAVHRLGIKVVEPKFTLPAETK